jgi:hypothetical protein
MDLRDCQIAYNKINLVKSIGRISAEIAIFPS